MNVIKGLIVKDFQTIKSYKSSIIFMLVIFIGTGCLNEATSTFLPIFLTLCFGMIGINSFSYDSLAKADKYILTLPVNKKDMVKARYIYILLVTLFGALFGFILTILVQSIKIGTIVNAEIIGNMLATILGTLSGIMILQAFEIPILYKFGAEKAKIIQIIMIVTLILGISLIATVVMNLFNISPDNLILMLKDYFIVIIGIVVVLLYILSYIISYKIYKRKEI